LRPMPNLLLTLKNFSGLSRAARRTPKKRKWKPPLAYNLLNQKGLDGKVGRVDSAKLLRNQLDSNYFSVDAQSRPPIDLPVIP
jgi:hypothetical protein